MLVGEEKCCGTERGCEPLTIWRKVAVGVRLHFEIKTVSSMFWSTQKLFNLLRVNVNTRIHPWCVLLQPPSRRRL